MISDELQELVNKQAEDQALWSIPPLGSQSIVEAHLQSELRKLHAAVENRVDKPPRDCSACPVDLCEPGLGGKCAREVKG